MYRSLCFIQGKDKNPGKDFALLAASRHCGRLANHGYGCSLKTPELAEQPARSCNDQYREVNELRLRVLESRDVRVGVFPEGQGNPDSERMTSHNSLE